jgi:hemerythrin-like domain-containing protein
MSLPVEILIIEHKLILQAVEAIKKKTDNSQTSQTVNPNDIGVIVDFFRTYADRFHHGKEEGLLFRALAQKKLNADDDKIMKDLMQEHAFARKTVTALEAAKESYTSGNKQAFQQVIEKLTTLTTFYPKHIEKEDEHFFYPSMQYFTPQEQKEMIAEFKIFNENFTDKRYTQIIAKM